MGRLFLGMFEIEEDPEVLMDPLDILISYKIIKVIDEKTKRA